MMCLGKSPAILSLFALFAVTPLAAQSEPSSSEKATTETRVIQNAICPVSKEPIGSMGKGKKVQHKGYEFSLCCAGCMDEFEKNPDAYLEEALKSGKARPADGKSTKTKEAASAEVTDIKNKNCPVSGAPVGSMQAGSHIIYKGQKVGLCCDGCIGKFKEDPEKYLSAAKQQ